MDWPAERLEQEIGNYEALIVRSATQVSAELIGLGTRLKVIGRAGTGVDNVDVEAATRRGIIVVNAPGANMVSAAEHAVGLLLAVARNIPQAHAALTAGRWERSRFAGVELASKTLGIVGFGRIGQLVAARARGLGMKVVVYDPFVSAERCRELQVTPVSLEELWPQAEFVTLHAPLTAETRHVINDESIAAMLPGVRIVNAARGELVDIDALVRGLGIRQSRGCGTRCLSVRAVRRRRGADASKRRCDAAPGRVHARGSGPGRVGGRRAGRGGAHRAVRLKRREYSPGRLGGHGGTRAVPAARPSPGTNRRGAV